MSVENIIFDLCGPVCDVDPRKIIDTFKLYGVQDAEKLFSELSSQKFLKEFETGKISADAFRNELRKILKLDLSDLAIDTAWNACFIRLPKKHVELLGFLKLNYRIFLLSNMDEINYSFFKDTFEAQLGFDFFQTVFTDCFISCRTGVRKPSSESFMQIIHKRQIPVERTIFIDDTTRHVETARKLQIKSHLLQSTENIQDLFDDKLCVKSDLFI